MCGNLKSKINKVGGNSSSLEQISNKEDEEFRKSYLIDYRNGLWTQIRAKEEVIWRFIAFFAGAIVLIVGFLKPADNGNLLLSPEGALILVFAVIIVSFWGILVTLDANYWMRSNLVIIANIEKDILKRTDFGNILPEEYIKHKHFQYTSSYFINLIFFCITSFLAVIGLIVVSIVNRHTTSTIIISVSQIASISYCMLLMYTIRRNQKWVNNYGSIIIKTPGKTFLKQKIFTQTLNDVGSFWDPALESYLSLMSVFGSIGLLFSTLYIQGFYALLPVLYWVLFIISLSLAILILILRLWGKNTFLLLHKKISDTTTEEQLKLNKELTLLVFWKKVIRIIEYGLLGITFLVNLYFLVVIIICDMPTLFCS